MVSLQTNQELSSLQLTSRQGPIVRINPHELHISDPEYYDDLYNFKKFDKYWWHVQQFGHPHSSANTVAHELHQKRRAAVGSYFSRGMIFRLEKEIIQKHIRIFCDRLDEFQATQKPMAIGTAYRAFTTDVISDYTMAKPFDFLKMPDFNQAWFDAFLENVGMVHFICQFPWFPSTAKKLPSFLRDRLLPRTSQFIKFHHVSRSSPADAYDLMFTLTTVIVACSRLRYCHSRTRHQ